MSDHLAFSVALVQGKTAAKQQPNKNVAKPAPPCFLLIVDRDEVAQ